MSIAAVTAALTGAQIAQMQLSLGYWDDDDD